LRPEPIRVCEWKSICKRLMLVFDSVLCDYSKHSKAKGKAMAQTTRVYLVHVMDRAYLVDAGHPMRALNHVLRKLRSEIRVEVCSPRQAIAAGRNGIEVEVAGEEVQQAAA